MPKQNLKATWNPKADFWAKTSEDTSEHSDVFLETFPTSGTTRNGQLFERPKSALLTSEPESSSSPGPEVRDRTLPTPKASDATRGENTPSEQKRDNPALTAVSFYFPDEVKGLPTPTVADGEKERNNPAQAVRKSPPLSAVSAIFPEEALDSEGDLINMGTPQARDGRGLPGPGFNRGNLNHDVKEVAEWNELPESAEDNPLDGSQDGHNTACVWGQYEPAIRRWETVLGRPAPGPIEPNRNNRPRLTAAFVEWMMGLDEGWVTEVPGIARANQIKILGNGVVPQQAEAALRVLVDRTPYIPQG